MPPFKPPHTTPIGKTIETTVLTNLNGIILYPAHRPRETQSPSRIFQLLWLLTAIIKMLKDCQKNIAAYGKHSIQEATTESKISFQKPATIKNTKRNNPKSTIIPTAVALAALTRKPITEIPNCRIS